MDDGNLNAPWSPASPGTAPRIIPYGHAEPWGRKFDRSLPRLTRRSLLLILITLALQALFLHDLPVWQKRTVVSRPDNGPSRESSIVAVVPGDHQVAVASETGLAIFDLATGSRVFSDPVANPQITQIRFSKSGSKMARLDENDLLYMYDLHDLKRLAVIHGIPTMGNGADAFSLSDDGTRLVFRTKYGASLCDADKGSEIPELPLHLTEADYLKMKATADHRLAATIGRNWVEFYRLSDGGFDHGVRLLPSEAGHSQTTAQSSRWEIHLAVNSESSTPLEKTSLRLFQ